MYAKILIIIALVNFCPSTQDFFNPWSEPQLYPPELIPDNATNTHRAVVKRKIVNYHNFFRSKVRPSASNMLMMSWHPAAKQAQEYADKCIFLQHNANDDRTVPHLGSCGQNLFVASKKSTWFYAIKSWFVEYKLFNYGAPIKNMQEIGHYTQMVWATSHKVGCGIALCNGGPWGQFYNFVCHYCPGGNIDQITQYPYKLGKPCADCSEHCHEEKLCTNNCPRKDYYSNCGELKGFTDVCQQGVCNATCLCGAKKLHKNYPWS